MPVSSVRSEKSWSRLPLAWLVVLRRVLRPGGRLILLNHFTQDSPIIAAVEKAISPICTRIGFRTDLSVDQVINGWPLIKERDIRVKPFGMWHVVECLNNK